MVIRHGYAMGVEPVGYPHPAVLCCHRDCPEPGLAWLNEEDMLNYHAEVQVIAIPRHGVEIPAVWKI